MDHYLAVILFEGDNTFIYFVETHRTSETPTKNVPPIEGLVQRLCAKIFHRRAFFKTI